MTEISSPATPPSSRVRLDDENLPLPERVSWEELGPEFIAAWGFPRGQWQPEHLEILGPTGSGKSYFEKVILTERARLRGSHIVILATKPADSTLKSMDWPIVTSWPPNRYKKGHEQVIYWARAKGLDRDGLAGQRAAVEDLLNKLWKPDSNIILVFDEISYIEKDLGLSTQVARYYREARALGITIVASTQRPQGVSRYVHSESSWSVFFAPKDQEDAKRMAEVAGNRNYYMQVLSELDRSKREFLLVHNLTNESYISHIAGKPAASTHRTSEPKSGGAANYQ